MKMVYAIFEHTDELVSDLADTPIEVTREQFEKIKPNFGYW